jgi:DNA invertase Pin-like site-specific DNA recombinase
MVQKAALGNPSSVQQASIVPVEKPSHHSYVEQLSWEYLMPKRKDRAAGYIRESDPMLADSTTIDSQANAVRVHCESEGYDYTADHEYREAISAYMVPYTQRPKLLELLAAAKRREFNVLVLSEIRALSRKRVEVFVIYDMLQKYGVRIETIQEKFEDSAIGRFILATRAMVAEVERENTFMRTQRGKRDRLANGAVNGHPKPAYGYIFIDTDREQKARYAFNNKVIYVDSEGTEWTEAKVCLYIFDLARQGMSIKGICTQLNEIGIPTPKKAWKGVAHWQPASIHLILTNRMYIGEVWANKYKQVRDAQTNNKKYLRQPIEEQTLLPEGTAPALIDRETFEQIQEQLEYNKQDSLRNNKHPEDLGILRAGYAFCGICQRRLHVVYHPPSAAGSPEKPKYECRRREGTDDISCNHNTRISLRTLDSVAWEIALEIIRQPELIRLQVAAMREENKPVVNTEDVAQTVETIKRKMANLYQLAMEATSDDTIETLKGLMHDLEKQKREAEAMLYDIEEDDEERQALEEEIVRFEKWVEKVQPLLTDPTYIPTYEEQRLAVRVLGIRAIVLPATGDWPFRYRIDVLLPKIIEKMKGCINNDRWQYHPTQGANGNGA